MDNSGIDFQEVQHLVESKTESEIKQQIYEKVRRRLAELETDRQKGVSFCHQLSPDVIVISDDQSLLFEPQNLRGIEWLRRRFGMDNLGIRDRLRVHPSQCQKMVRELKAAGFDVVY